MDYRKQFIENSKSAVLELIRVLQTDIKIENIETGAKAKKALQIKKKAFVQSKSIIAGVLEFDYRQQDWARESIENLIQAGDESIQALIDSLDDKIKLNDKGISNDADDIINEIDSKGIAFEDIMQLIDSVDELKRIAEDDEIVMNGNEFSGGYAELYADKIASKKFKSGYDSEIDAVVICPKGTIGEIIEIADLRIALPKKPARKSILNNEKRKRDQYWIRQSPPKGMGRRNAKRYESFIEGEYDRRVNGMWFFNNGIAEYITGAHWMHMTHCRTAADGGYYYFTKAQQKLFYFMEAVWVDERCAGMILEKIRRFGATDMFMSFSLHKTTLARDKISGMTSKKDSDAKKNFLRQTWMFSNWPFYFKPICVNDRSKSGLEFISPAKKLSKNNKDKTEIDDSLNSFVDFESTSEDSYDGVAMYVYIGDEYSKWKKQNGNTITHFEMVSKSSTKGARFTGKMFLFSTIENVTGKDPEKDEDALAGDRFKWLYYNSDPKSRDENGQTLTGMYKLFISCLEHYEGFIDRHGYAITEDPKEPIETADGEIKSIGIRTFINNKLAAFGTNMRARNEFLRKTPLEEDDGFRIGEGTSSFNQVNITSQMNYNNSLPKNRHGLPGPLRRGNFEWKDGIKDCGIVYWEDNPEGRFIISWMPDPDIRNNCIMRGRVRYPGNTSIGAFGVDTYRVNKTVDGKGSKGAIHGSTKVNPSAPSNFFFLEYLCRPDNKSIFHDDAIKSFVFYGMPALIENNVNNLLEEMYERGYRQYSLNRPDKPYDKLSPDEKKYGGIPSSGENIIQMQTLALESYIDYFVGEIKPEEFGNMYFNNTLGDWLVYDAKNRTKRDASISSSLSRIACNIKGKRESNPNKNKRAVSALVRRYDNRGSVATKLK